VPIKEAEMLATPLAWVDERASRPDSLSRGEQCQVWLAVCLSVESTYGDGQQVALLSDGLSDRPLASNRCSRPMKDTHCTLSPPAMSFVMTSIQPSQRLQ